jgi:SAM-dependent methyltransferase
MLIRAAELRDCAQPAPGDPAPASALYGSTLARLHHEHFGHVARAAATSLLAQLSAAGHDRGHVLDLAAGSGILSRALSDAGYEVSGVDLSESMLELARSHAPAARFERASLWSCPLPKCVAIAAVGEAFGYRSDDPHTWPALGTRLCELAAALQPGGVLLFDVAAPGRSGPTRSRRTFWSLSDAAIGLVESEDPGVLRRDISMFVAKGEQYQRQQEQHVLELYAPEAVEAALSQAGLTWQRLSGYVGFELPSGWLAYAATKPSR